MVKVLTETKLTVEYLVARHKKKRSIVMLKTSVICTEVVNREITRPSGCALKDVSDGFVSLFMPEI